MTTPFRLRAILAALFRFVEGKPDTLGLAFSIVLRDELLP